MSKKRKPPLETVIQKSILQACALLPGVRLWRMNTASFVLPNKDGSNRMVRAAFPGCSDILGWKTEAGVARFVAIEVKRPGGPGATPEQKAFLRAVEASGGIHGVARSVTDAYQILGFELKGNRVCRIKTLSPL